MARTVVKFRPITVSEDSAEYEVLQVTGRVVVSRGRVMRSGTRGACWCALGVGAKAWTSWTSTRAHATSSMLVGRTWLTDQAA